MKKNREKIFLIALFLVGLFTVFSYGAHLDQRTEQGILYSNVKMYLRCLGGKNSSLYGQLDSLGIVDIAEAIDRDHGMAVYYPMFWMFYMNQFSPYIGNILWHIYIYLLVFCGVLALYGLSREMFGDFRVSALATSLFFFTPRMFAESHYNNKDMVLLSLTLCVFYFGWKLWKNPSWKYVAAFSLAGSLAANIKIIGIWIWGIVGLYILCAMLCEHRFDKKIFGKMLGCIVLAALLYLLFTPASWAGLAQFVEYQIGSAVDYRWNDYVLFGGRMYSKSTTGIPRRYLPVMILLTVPAGILLLALAGICGLLFSLVKKRSGLIGPAGYACVSVLAGLVPLGYAVLSGTPLYNGWRHFYFCYGSILILTAYGIFSLLNLLEKYRRRAWGERAIGIYVLLLAGGILLNHPYEYVYYNLFAGSSVKDTYELDYWDMSFKQAYEKVLKNSSEEQITIGTVSNPAKWGLDSQLYAIRGKYRMRIVLCEDWRDAQYLIINPTYAYMYGRDDYDYIRQNYTLTDHISSYGNIICEIYRQ